VKSFTISLISKFVGRQYIDNTSSKDRSLDPWFVNNINLGYSVQTKFFDEIGVNLSINNLFSTKYETYAWAYRYYFDNKPYEYNGYFPQALFNVLVGISIKI
jgi:iron complex outermembrane receptor protein